MTSAARTATLSPLQLAASKRSYPPVPRVCAVTGATGFVGSRLVEMLVERGAEKVRCLDIVPPPSNAWRDPRIEYIVGDICDEATVTRFVTGADCVWHNAAAVGPFHPRDLYFKVNYEGTLNVIRACRDAGVRKIVMSSSPSTRFDGSDVDGLTEEQMPPLPQKRYLQTYAETKAMGEKALTDASCDELMTCAVAPHQVYGPRDNLFLPNLLEAAGTGRLRIFGEGKNRICFTHVDNYAHGLIIAERALHSGSPALGKFYIVTDGATHPHKEVCAHAIHQHLAPTRRALDSEAVCEVLCALATAHPPSTALRSDRATSSFGIPWTRRPSLWGSIRSNQSSICLCGCSLSWHTSARPSGFALV